MSGFLGAIGGVAGDIAGAFTGGDFLSELMDVAETAAAQASGSNNNASEAAQIESDMMPVVTSFL